MAEHIQRIDHSLFERLAAEARSLPRLPFLQTLGWALTE
jgi:hypothetical protein